MMTREEAEQIYTIFKNLRKSEILSVYIQDTTSTNGDWHIVKNIIFDDRHEKICICYTTSHTRYLWTEIMYSADCYVKHLNDFKIGISIEEYLGIFKMEVLKDFPQLVKI